MTLDDLKPPQTTRFQHFALPFVSSLTNTETSYLMDKFITSSPSVQMTSHSLRWRNHVMWPIYFLGPRLSLNWVKLQSHILHTWPYWGLRFSSCADNLPLLGLVGITWPKLLCNYHQYLGNGAR